LALPESRIRLLADFFFRPKRLVSLVEVPCAVANEVLELYLLALSAEGIAYGPVEASGGERLLFEEVRGAKLHGLDVDLPLSLAGEQDHWQLTSAFFCFLEEIEPRTHTKAVIKQAQVVLPFADRLETFLVRRLPIERDAADLAEMLPRQQIVIFVVVNEQHINGLLPHASLRWVLPAARRSPA